MDLKKLTPYIAGAVIAVASYFTGAVTDVGGALSIALDKEQAKVACGQLLDGQDLQEMLDAAVAETETAEPEAPATE